MDNPFKSPTILSFCTGGRGLERGLERAIAELWGGKNRDDIKGGTVRKENSHGIRVAAFVEIGSFECENLVQAMERGVLAPTPIWSNAKTFPAQGFRDKIHGIIGGYPCQPFSQAGQRKGTEDPRHLWPFIREHIRAIRPVWCFFENVEGHLTLGFPEVYQDLSDMGYKVEAGIFSAREVGAPHQRKRLFILAIATGVALGNSCGGNGFDVSGEFGKVRKKQSVISNSSDGPQVGVGQAHSDLYGHLHSESELNTEEGQFDALCDTSASSSKNVADTSSIGSSSEKKNNGRGKQNEIGREVRPGTVPGRTSDVGNSDIEGLEGRITGNVQECSGKGSSWQNGPFCQEDRWPAGYGQPQYEWEERRITESGFCCTVDGYNFREDLLRMYGNGVVEWTAKKAFITLLNKHLND